MPHAVFSSTCDVAMLLTTASAIKLAAPKSKYIEHILIATHTGEAGVAEVFRALQNRLRDSTWTIVFKSLIVVHLMMREGEKDITLKYLSSSPLRKLAINNFTEGTLGNISFKKLLDGRQHPFQSNPCCAG
jgi:hypothetical protein